MSQGNPRADLLQNGLVGSPCSPKDSQESSRDELEMQIIGLHPMSAESESLGVQPSYLSFTDPSGDSNAHLSSTTKNQCLDLNFYII